MPVLLFEDAAVTRLYPITVGRPAFQITCGSFRLVEMAQAAGPRVSAWVRPHLFSSLQEDLPAVCGGPPAPDEPVLLVNARLAPSLTVRKGLAQLWQAREPTVWKDGPDLAVAYLRPRAEWPSRLEGWQRLAQELATNAVESPAGWKLLEYPHDVIRQHLLLLRESLEYRLQHGEYREISDGVFVAPTAKLGEIVITDASGGPIVLDEHASIGPYCYLRGPVYLGPGARVIEHASIKDGVGIGHTVKLGGEVEGCVIEPYTNKQHHGFLGHSYLGSWINLGAGTCNSDLKNTYGTVNMDYAGHRVPTGMQFLGSIFGDYAKTAINTGIFTGKTIGVCSMVYGFVTTNVPSFTNYARSFGQVTEAPADVMVAAQARMFARRNVAQRPCDVDLLHAMYELTRSERQLAGEPLSL